MKVYKVVSDSLTVFMAIECIEIYSLRNVHSKITKLLSLEDSSEEPWSNDAWVRLSLYSSISFVAGSSIICRITVILAIILSNLNSDNVRRDIFISKRKLSCEVEIFEISELKIG